MCFLPNPLQPITPIGWPFSEPPIAAQCWRVRGGKILKVLGKKNTICPEVGIYKRKILRKKENKLSNKKKSKIQEKKKGNTLSTMKKGRFKKKEKQHTNNLERSRPSQSPRKS